MDVTIHILTEEQILENLALYQEQMDSKLTDNPVEIVEQATVAESIMTNSGKILADSKYWLRQAMHSETINKLKELAKQEKIITATAVNEVIGSLCRQQHYLVDWSERINRSATHRVDLCRTIISKHKAERPQYFQK